MAASVTASVGIGSNSPSTTLETGTLTPTGSNKAIYVLVGSGATSPSNLSSVKYASASGTGGESLTQLDSTRTVATNLKMSIYKLASPSASSGTIWAQWAGTDDERWIIALALQNTTGTEGTIAYNSAVTSSSGTATATTTAGDLVLSFISVLDIPGGPAALTAGQTSVYELDTSTPGTTGIGSNEAAGASSAIASTTTQAMTWTLSAARDWGEFAFQVNGASGPNITSTSDSSPAVGSSLTITGTAFGASQGAGSVTIGGTTQTVTSWADTSITVTVSRGTNKYGSPLNVVVTDNSAAVSNSYSLTGGLTPQSGWSYVNVASPNTWSSVRLTATPDIATGDQIAWDNKSGEVTVFPTAIFWASSSVTSFDFEVWTTDGWGTSATQYIGDLAVFAWPPKRIQKRGLQARALFDTKAWAGIAVEKWFADELTPAAGGSNVTLALTGVSATGAVGSLGDAVSYALTGNQATGQVGNVGDSISFALTGNQATGQVGSVKSDISYALTGNQATGAVGTVSAGSDISLALTGVAATGQVGSLTANVSYALTGNQATGQVGTVTTGNDVSLALTGIAATGQVGTLSPALSVALTGVQATGQVGTATASLSFALSGNQSAGAVGSVGDAVSYALSGVQATGEAGTVSVVGDVTKALTGVEATGQVGNVSIPITDDRIAIRGWIGDKKRDVNQALKAGWGSTVDDRSRLLPDVESGVVEESEEHTKPTEDSKNDAVASASLALAKDTAQNARQVSEAAALVAGVIEQAARESLEAEQARKQRIKAVMLKIAELL